MGRPDAPGIAGRLSGHRRCAAARTPLYIGEQTVEPWPPNAGGIDVRAPGRALADAQCAAQRGGGVVGGAGFFWGAVLGAEPPIRLKVVEGIAETEGVVPRKTHMSGHW
jgi:hypothetical protein